MWEKESEQQSQSYLFVHNTQHFIVKCLQPKVERFVSTVSIVGWPDMFDAHQTANQCRKNICIHTYTHTHTKFISLWEPETRTHLPSLHQQTNIEHIHTLLWHLTHSLEKSVALTGTCNKFEEPDPSFLLSWGFRHTFVHPLQNQVTISLALSFFSLKFTLFSSFLSPSRFFSQIVEVTCSVSVCTSVVLIERLNEFGSH